MDLLTVSLREGTVNFQTFDDEVWVSDIKLIDAETGRIGFQSSSPSNEGRKFVFGTIDAAGAFTAEGEIATDSYGQGFYPHQDSITVTTEGGLKTYSYDNPEEAVCDSLCG